MVLATAPGLALGQSANKPKPKAEKADKKETAAEKTPAAGDATKAAAAPVDPKTYVIGAEDVLFVSVWREPEFTRQVVVRPDGKISLNLISDVQAAGLTPEQLGGRVKEALQKIMNTPDVSISVIQVNSKKYYMNGEIGRPGPYPMPVPVTILEALSNAGGFRDFANKKKVVILRGSKRLYFNYTEVVKGKKMEQNIVLQPGDQIFVN